MNRSRVLLPALAGALLLGVGVYFTGGGLGGDASGAGCAGGQVVDVQQDVGITDKGIDATLAELSAWDAARLADPNQRPEFDAKLVEVVQAGPDALPSLVNVVQTQACNEPTSGPFVDAIHQMIVEANGTVDGVEGVAGVLVTAASQGLTEFDLPATDGPTFSSYSEFEALAQKALSVDANSILPEITTWQERYPVWHEVVEDNSVRTCSLRALDATIALDHGAAFDALTGAIKSLPPNHPAGVALVEAAIDLSAVNDSANAQLQQIALNPDMFVNVRAQACRAATWDPDAAQAFLAEFQDLSDDDVAAILASCSIVEMVDELPSGLADRIAAAPSPVIQTARARAMTKTMDDNTTWQELFEMLVQPAPDRQAPVCKDLSIICNYGEVATTVDDLVEIVEANGAQDQLREKIETAIVEADPQLLTRLAVLARAGDELWPARIPGLGY